MKAYQWLIVAAAMVTAFAGIALFDSSESSADPEFSEYMVYYVIDDPRLTPDQYSIDLYGLYVTDDYVFFRTVPAAANATVGQLPATENIVSRYYSYDLSHDGFVVNPTGTSGVYDASGWFAESTYQNRVTPSTLLSSLDTDDDGIVTIHMKAARLYDVVYHMRNRLNGSYSSFMWYDGYHLERTDAHFNENRFTDVDYCVKFVEGMTVPENLPTTADVYSPSAGSGLYYLPLSNWAKDDGAYINDVYSVGGQDRSWFVKDANYPDINTNNCTPVYPGLVVSSALDPDGNGVIELYGTSTRLGNQPLLFFLTVTFAQQDTNLRYYGTSGYDGRSEMIVQRVEAEKIGSDVTISGYKLLLPDYAGFEYGSYSIVSNIDSVTVQYETVDGVSGYYATISGSVSDSASNYSGMLTINFARRTVPISVVGETTTVYNVAYGTTLDLDSTFVTHTLYRWTTSNLHNEIITTGPYFQYLVSLEDLDAVGATITAEWQDRIDDRTIYTVEYVSRVNGVTIVQGIVEESGYLTLPMIENPGFSHLGWALVNPDIEIVEDFNELIIYPGRTSFQPASVGVQYKNVDPVNEHMVTVRLYAIWCSTYTIQFNANGGSGTMPATDPIMVNEHFTLPLSQFTRTDYEFEGWATTANGDVQYTDGATVTGLARNSGDVVTLFAVWRDTESRNVYVVFDANGGNGSMNAQSATLSRWTGRVDVTLNQNTFTRTGYTFYGWSLTQANSVYSPSMSISGSNIRLDGNNIGYIDRGSVTLTGSISLYAIWKPNTYYVAFDANGGTGSMGTQTFTYGTAQALTLNSFTKAGSNFGGWTDGNGRTYSNGYIVSNLTSVNGATVTLYAVWSYYYIEIHSNDVNGYVNRLTATPGVEFPIPECDYVYEGHLFVSWNTAADGSGTTYMPGAKIIDLAADKGTAHLYAIWETYHYYIAFNSSDGSGSMSTLTAQGGVPITLTLNSFTKGDRQFLGWAISAGGAIHFTDGETVTDIGSGVNEETVTLYAVWSKKTISITVAGLMDSASASDSAAAWVAFGLSGESDMLEDEAIMMSLNNSAFTKYLSYVGTGRNPPTYYLVGWEHGSDTYDYGDLLTLEEGMNGWTLTAKYVTYSSIVRYHSNFDTDQTVDMRFGLTETTSWGQKRYNGSTHAAACSFDRPGYMFLLWSTSANSVSGSALPGIDEITVSNARANASVDQVVKEYYAVWVVITGPDAQYYTGSDITPSPTVTVYIKNSATVVNNYTALYSDNRYPGTANVHITMPNTYRSVEFNVPFTVLKAQVTIDTYNIDKYYGESDPSLAGTPTCPTATVNGLNIIYTRVAGENAGTYAISASLESSHYELVSPTPGTLTINPARVSIDIDDASKYYGEADPAFSGELWCLTAPTEGLVVIYTRESGESPGTYVISASINDANFILVSQNTGILTIIDVPFQYAHYIILDGRGGSVTYTDDASVPSGTPFAAKTVTANSGYAFHEWVLVTYNNGRIVALTHITYSPTLEAGHAAGTYMAIFETGDAIVFDGNGGTGSMSKQDFADRSGTLDANTFERSGYVFRGWSTASDGDVVYSDRTPLILMTGLSTADESNRLYAVWAPVTYTSTLYWTIDGYVIESNGSFLKTDSGDTFAIVSGNTSATISSAWLDVLDGNGKGLRAELSYGSLTFDDDVVSYLESLDKDITFSVRPVATEGSDTFEVKNGNAVVAMYSITASYVDNNGIRQFIHDLHGNAVVTLVKPAAGSSVVYVGDNGGQPTNVSSDAETITCTTNHFSLYGIVEDVPEETAAMESASVPGPSDEESTGMILTIGAIAALLSCTAGALVFLRRRQ